jgi:hypothetical protein
MTGKTLSNDEMTAIAKEINSESPSVAEGDDASTAK